MKKLLLASLVLYCAVATAQQTGSFDRTINFNGSNRVLSYYVPASYNASNKYKLVIGLHGLGDTPQNYRSAMVYMSQSSGNPVSNSIGISPSDGSDSPTSDFWTPVSDTAIITKCISDAMSIYNIDPANIYLNGFSLGGRSALRYGLLNYSHFKGILLWTPAVQTLNEANNLTSFNYVYQNARYVPVTISVGGDDGYNFILSTVYQHLSDAGGIANFQVFYGMGHQAPPFSYVVNELKFLDTNGSSFAKNDAGVSEIAAPFKQVCGSSFTPVVTIQNKGANNLTSALINYQLDGGTVNTYNWLGNLKQLGKNQVTLPAQSVSAGAHVFKAYTTMPNGTADSVPSNDNMIVNFNSIDSGVTLLSEGFEGATFPPSGWRMAGSDSAWTWKKAQGSTTAEFNLLTTRPTGANGQSTSCIFFDNDLPDNLDKHYSIRTPECDFSNVNSPSLTYNYAYAPYNDTSGATGRDTLAVYYSTDCGNTWSTLLKKGGIALSTAAGYSTEFPFVPTSSQWKQQSINLNIAGLVGQPEVMFSFENRSNWGHTMYLDNINISAVTGIPYFNAFEGVVIYPNPASDQLTIHTLSSSGEVETVSVINIVGDIVHQEKVKWSNNISIDIKNLSSGVYFIQLKTENGSLVKRFVKE